MQKVILIPGDWAGPQVCEAMCRVVKAAGADIDWQKMEPQNMDWSAILAEDSIIVKSKTKDTEGETPFAVKIRKELGLNCTIRTAKGVPGLKARFPDIDVVVFRETSEDIYSGFEHQVTEGVFEAVKITTEAACEQIARSAYQYAVKKGRKKVTIVHKSNIMKKSDGLFLRTAQRVGNEFPNVETEEFIVDALCMKLTQYPYRFDILLTANLFGDIVSDLCTGLAGGSSAATSYSEGKNKGKHIRLYENIHDLQYANPIPMLNVAVSMLEDIGEETAAKTISTGITQLLESGVCTEDIGGKHSLEEFVNTLISSF